jgi:hypothetical protein
MYLVRNGVIDRPLCRSRLHYSRSSLLNSAQRLRSTIGRSPVTGQPEHLGGAFFGIRLSHFFSSSLACASVVKKGAFAFR